MSIAAKAIVVGVAKKAPSALSWIHTRLFGKELLIVGPPAAGKSSICEYLIYGELRRPELERVKTTSIETQKPVTLEVGDQKRLNFRLKRTIDVPGQFLKKDAKSPQVENEAIVLKEYGRAHADLFLHRKPNCLLIVLDVNEVLSGSIDWLAGFVEELYLREEESLEVIQNTQSLHLALNKYDLIEPKNLDTARKYIKDCLKIHLGDLQELLLSINMLPANGTVTRYNKEFINYLIFEIAKTVERKK